MAVLGPSWSRDFGLNPNLVAGITACDRHARTIPEANEVQVAFTEANLDHSADWGDPWANAGISSYLNNIANAAQSGVLTDVARALGPMRAPSFEGDGLLDRAARALGIANLTQNLVDRYNATRDQAVAAANNLEGRSGLTKINSTLIFVAAKPVTLNATVLLKAFQNPAVEVEQPLAQLVGWLAPRKLGDGSALVNLLKTGSLFDTAFPSLTPTMVSLRFGGIRLAPMVITAISEPLTAPRTASGARAAVVFQMAMQSLAAWDAEDHRNSRLAVLPSA